MQAQNLPQSQALPGPGATAPTRVTAPASQAPPRPQRPTAPRGPPPRIIYLEGFQQDQAPSEAQIQQALAEQQTSPTPPTRMRGSPPQALPIEEEFRPRSKRRIEQVPAEPSTAQYPAPLTPAQGPPATIFPQVPTSPSALSHLAVAFEQAPLPPLPLSSRPLFTPRSCPPGFDPAQFELQEALKELMAFSRDDRLTWLHLAGLYLQHVWVPTLFPVGQRLWQRDVKKDDLLEKFPGAAAIWPAPEAGTLLEAMVGALGNSDFGRAVLQIAISQWSFAAPIREVEEVMNLASWKIPDLDPDVFTIGKIKNMAEGPEKQALLAQVEARSPRFFRKCMEDPLCGMYAIPTLSMKSRCKICRKLTSVIKHKVSGSQSRPPTMHQSRRDGGARSGREAGRRIPTGKYMDQQRASHPQTSSSNSWQNKGRRRYFKKKNAKPDLLFSKLPGRSNRHGQHTIQRLG